MLREFINRYLLTTLVGLFVLGFVSHSAYDMIETVYEATEIKKFMKEGPRYTLHRGEHLELKFRELCAQTNEISAKLEFKQLDCEI